MLDRGEQNEWFDAWETWIEAGLALSALWMFAVHTATAREAVVPPAIFRDRNVMTALIFSAVMGVLLMASMSLMPPMLQHLFGYPIVTTGLVLAPRGVDRKSTRLNSSHANISYAV